MLCVLAWPRSLTLPGPRPLFGRDMLPFMLGIMIPIVLGSAAIVSWAIATSKPAPDYIEADELLRRLGPSHTPEAVADIAQKARKAS